MTLEQLHEAVAIEFDLCYLDEIEDSRINNPEDILGLGGSLLSVSETGHVKLAHLSVRDYLLYAVIQATPLVCRFSMSPQEANQELAIYCIAYLSVDSLAIGPSTTLEGWEDRLALQPLLKHAAKAWPCYLRAANANTKLKDTVYRFCTAESRQVFMSWIQVLNSNWIFEWKDYPRHATSLYYAASFGLGDLVDGLIKEGADLDAPGSRFGGTALHGATLRQHVSIMRTLLETGAAPSQADFNHITPLHTAVIHGNAEVVSLLLEFGAPKDAVDSLGETPCDWALKAGQATSLKLLQGVDCQLSNHSSNTKQNKIWRRATALFPTMAVAQGFPAC